MKIGKLIIQHKWLREFLLFIFLLLVSLLNEREDITSEHGFVDGIFIFIFLYLHLQIHRFFILPLLDKGDYLIYVLASTVLVLLFTGMALASDYYFTNVGWYDELEGQGIQYLVRFYLFSFTITIPLLVAIHRVFKQLGTQLKSEQDKVLLRDMELNLLKKQTNPHFLFNALNGLYGLSLEKPELLPDKILQLSDIMRYNVQWSQVKWITLKQELSYVKQFIEFESDRMRTYVDVMADFNIDPKALQSRVAPMLLIYFIENAFKHVRRNSKDCYIHVLMKVQDNTLFFSVHNTFVASTQTDYSLSTGITNVKRRLSILYPNAFVLHIRAEQEIYTVQLELRLHLPDV